MRPTWSAVSVEPKASQTPDQQLANRSIRGLGDSGTSKYLIGYILRMTSNLLEHVRQHAGLTQQQLASRAGTSRPTLSAYEHGHKSPTLATVERILDGAGFELSAVPKVAFHEITRDHGRPFFVADRLWRLPIEEALADIVLPMELNWSYPGRLFHLRDRRQRARCYEITLREGMPSDMKRYIDGALLVDLWTDLVLPREIRDAWLPVIDAAVP